MADSYLLTVEKALTAHIGVQLTPANGSPFDLTGAVFRGRVRMGRSDPLPMVSLIQSPDIEVETTRSGAEQLRRGSKLYLLQGWVADDPENPTDPAHELLAEMKRATGMLIEDLESEHHYLRAYHPQGRYLISDLEISVGLVRPPDELSPDAYCWLPVRIGLVENVAEPYALP